MVGAGMVWPLSMGEWLASNFTHYGCMVPDHGCVKYDPNITVRILLSFFMNKFYVRKEFVYNPQVLALSLS